MRKLLLLGAERVDEASWQRIHAALDAGDPGDDLRDCWVAKEKVRDVYLTDDEELAAERLDDAIAWCSAPESGPELRRLVKVLRRWRKEILAHHRTGASNGPVEAAITWSLDRGVRHVVDVGSQGRGRRVLWSDVLMVTDGSVAVG